MALKCLKPIRLTKNLSPVLYPDGLEVPCGKCLHCRKQYARQWSTRLYHELSYHEKSCFITLTYSDENVPVNEETRFMTLRKKDLQKFFKRLRKRLDNRRLKYYACGEYGTSTQRPHYHIIIYGVGLSDDDRAAVMDSWKLCDWKNSTIRKKAFGLVETRSIQYVASYIDKKFSGALADEEYDQKGREPIFRLVSAGIGRRFVIENEKQIFQDGFIRLSGTKRSLPRYYLNTLAKTKEKEVEDLKLKIKQNAEFAECEIVEDVTGLNTSVDVFYKTQNPMNVMKLVNGIKSKRIQHDTNLNGKLKLFRSNKQ